MMFLLFCSLFFFGCGAKQLDTYILFSYIWNLFVLINCTFVSQKDPRITCQKSAASTSGAEAPRGAAWAAGHGKYGPEDLRGFSATEYYRRSAETRV